MAFAWAMAAKALSNMATMRCCSGSGGSGSSISLFADTLVLSSGNKNRIIKDKFFTNNSNIQFVEVNGEMYFSNGKNLFKGKLK